MERRTVDTARPTAVADAGMKGGDTADGTTCSDSQTHRPGPQGWRTTSGRPNIKSEARRRDGVLLVVSEDRRQRRRHRPDPRGWERSRGLANDPFQDGRNQAVGAVVGHRAGHAGMLAGRRGVIAGATLDREEAGGRPQEEGEAGEESGTGGKHRLHNSCGLTEVKRDTAFRVRNRGGIPSWS